MRPRIGITSMPGLADGRRIERVNRSYVEAVDRAGGLALVLPTLPPALAAETLAGLDGLVLSGGGDVAPARYGEEPVPEDYGVDLDRDAWEAALLSAAGAGPEVPLLCICRGAQLLNVEAGGTLVQHLPRVSDENHRQPERDRDAVHTVDLAAGSLLAGVLATPRIGVNSRHHQAVDRLGAGLRAVAWAPDGTIEAVERSDGAPILAVQWHPESLVDLPAHGRLFLWLTRAAARRRPGLEVPAAFEPAPAVGDVA